MTIFISREALNHVSIIVDANGSQVNYICPSEMKGSLENYRPTENNNQILEAFGSEKSSKIFSYLFEKIKKIHIILPSMGKIVIG